MVLRPQKYSLSRCACIHSHILQGFPVSSQWCPLNLLKAVCFFHPCKQQGIARHNLWHTNPRAHTSFSCILWCSMCNTPSPPTKAYIRFFSISRIVSRLIVPKPSFLPKVSAKSSNVHLALPWEVSLQASAINSATCFWPYFLGCPLRGFSSSALARPSFKNRFLVRQIVVRSTSKKSSISISFLSLWSNKKIFGPTVSRGLLLPDFLKERK